MALSPAYRHPIIAPGCKSIIPAQTAWGCPCLPLLPRSWVQSPHPVPFLPHSLWSLSPRGWPWLPTIPAMGTADVQLREQPCSVLAPACREGCQPLPGSWSIQRTARLSGAHSARPLGRTVLPSSITQVLVLHLISAGGTLALGRAGPPSPSHPRTALSEATAALSCLREAVWEEGRWGGSDVAKPPSPWPVPLLAPSLPQLGAPSHS